jgi:hypothetical protein
VIKIHRRQIKIDGKKTSKIEKMPHFFVEDEK